MRPHHIRGGARPSEVVEPNAALGMGLNASGWVYYSQDQPFRDLVRNANGFTAYGVTDNPPTTYVAVDAQGWPTADFRIRPQAPAKDSTPTGTIYGRFNGKLTNGASDFVWVFSGGFTLNTSSWAYDSGTNTTTFSINFVSLGYDQPFSFELRNTCKDGSTPNTGITNLQLSRPPYTLADLAVATFTPEYINTYSRYTFARHLGSMGGWMDVTTTDWDTRSTFENTRTAVTYKNPAAPEQLAHPFELFITLSNESNNGLYITLPLRCSDDYITNMMALIQSTLNPGKTIWYELGNEAWNFSAGRTYGALLHDASVVSKSIYGTYENSPGINKFSQNATRDSSGILTLTFPEGHPYTNGDLIYPLGFTGISSGAATTVTVVDANTITVPTTVLTAGTVTTLSNWRASGPLTHELRYSSSLSVDPEYDFYQIAFRWMAKRTKEISELVRAAVGDTEFSARHRVVLADQMVSGGYASKLLNYLLNKFPAHPPSYYIDSIAGAPYVFPKPYVGSGSNTAGTLDQFVAAYQAGCELESKRMYSFESRAQQARRYGVRSITYEHGLDGQWDSASSAQRNIIVRAGFDSRLQNYIRDYVIDFWRLGGSDVCWFVSGITPLDSDSAYGCFSLRTTRTDETTAKVAATNELITTPYPAQGRLTSPGTWDIRAHVNTFPPLYYNGVTNEVAPLKMRSTAGSDFTGSVLEYATWCDSPGVYTVTINYGCWQSTAGRTWQVENNGVVCGAVVQGPQTSSGFETFNNPINVTRSITLAQGWNDIRIRMTTAGDYAGEYGFWAISVT